MSSSFHRSANLFAAAAALSASVAGAVPTVQYDVRAEGATTIALPFDASNSATAVSIAWDPTLGLYYGGAAGNAAYFGKVWNASGKVVQTRQPIGVDLRSLDFDPTAGSGGEIEAVAWDAALGGSPDPVVYLGRSANGYLDGSTTPVYPDGTTMPGFADDDTSPAFDPGRRLYYSFGSGSTVNSVFHDGPRAGTLAGTISLDLHAAGVTTLQGEFIGYDPGADVLVALDANSARALVFGMDGSFRGASAVPDFHPAGGDPKRWNAGYANGQLFVYDAQIGGYEGYQILQVAVTTSVPEPAAAVLLIAALAVTAARRRFSCCASG